MFTRDLLLLSITWIIRLTSDRCSSRRAELLRPRPHPLVGGLFLIGKSTYEIHEKLEGDEGQRGPAERADSFTAVIFQILLLDIVFSLDSVITAVGMVDDLGGHDRCAW